MDLGHATNNEVELTTIRQRLIITKTENYQRLIIEGDSAMVIGVLSKLQQGSTWEKIRKSCPTENLIHEIGSLIKKIQYLIPLHVR